MGENTLANNQLFYPVLGLILSLVFCFCLKYQSPTRRFLSVVTALCVSWATIGFLISDYQKHPTTGISNQKVFYNSMDMILRQGSTALLLIDGDHFKAVNDTLGHNEGSNTLRKLSRLFQRNIPSKGKLFHWGGDEFAILLPATDEKDAFVIAEKLRSSVALQTDLHGVTISIGVAISQNKDNSEKLFNRADKALYDAKKSRNKVVIYRS